MNKTLAIFAILLLVLPSLVAGYGGGGGGSSFVYIKAKTSENGIPYYHIPISSTKGTVKLSSEVISSFSYKIEGQASRSAIDIYESKTSSIINIPGKVYRDYLFDSSVKNKGEYSFEFKVPKSLTDDPNKIKIIHIKDNGEVEDIEVELMRQMSASYFYKVKGITSFSEYIILIADENPIPNAGITNGLDSFIEETIPEPKVQETAPFEIPPEPTPAEEVNNNGMWLVGAIIIIVLVVGYFLIKRR